MAVTLTQHAIQTRQHTGSDLPVSQYCILACRKVAADACTFNSKAFQDIKSKPLSSQQVTHRHHTLACPLPSRSADRKSTQEGEPHVLVHTCYGCPQAQVCNIPIIQRQIISANFVLLTSGQGADKTLNLNLNQG